MNQSAELAAAAATAAAAEAEITGGATPAPGAATSEAGAVPEAAKLAELKAENMGLIELALAMLEPVLPFIRQCYTPEACEKIAQAGAEVEAKYGVSIGDLFAKYKPEIMLAIAVIPPTISAVTLTRELLAKRRAISSAKPEPGPGGGVVVPLKPEGGGGGPKTTGTT